VTLQFGASLTDDAGSVTAGLVYLGGELDEVAGDVIGELDVDFCEKRPRGSSTSCKKNSMVSNGLIL
jgi:hypothetical protein